MVVAIEEWQNMDVLSIQDLMGKLLMRKESIKFKKIMGAQNLFS